MIQTTIGIEGMMCSMCESHINDAIRRQLPVRSVKADRKKSLCTIVSDEPLDEARLRQVIADTGYELTGITVEPYQKRSFFSRFGRA